MTATDSQDSRTTRGKAGLVRVNDLKHMATNNLKGSSSSALTQKSISPHESSLTHRLSALNSLLQAASNPDHSANSTSTLLNSSI